MKKIPVTSRNVALVNFKRKKATERRYEDQQEMQLRNILEQSISKSFEPGRELVIPVRQVKLSEDRVNAVVADYKQHGWDVEFTHNHMQSDSAGVILFKEKTKGGQK